MLLLQQPEVLKDIAEELDMGMVCFYHLQTGAVESIPDADNSEMDDPELWRETIDKVEDDYDNYLRFEPMGSRESFLIMTDFVEELPAGKERYRLADALERPKPFQQFKNRLHDYPTLLEQWYAYKLQRYIAYVKRIAEAQEI